MDPSPERGRSEEQKRRLHPSPMVRILKRHELTSTSAYLERKPGRRRLDQLRSLDLLLVHWCWWHGNHSTPGPDHAPCTAARHAPSISRSARVVQEGCLLRSVMQVPLHWGLTAAVLQSPDGAEGWITNR